MSKRVLKKIQGAFQELGIGLEKGRSLIEFEYEHVFMFLSMDAKDQSIAFITYVVESCDVSMDESILNTALEIVEGFHEDCCGDWNDGVPYFVSPCYEPRTMPTLQALQEDCPDANLYFVMGADKLKLLTHLTGKRYYVQRATDPDIACLQLDERRKRGYTLKAMGAALWALWHPVDFTEGLVTVVNEGGDADSNGAPAGAVLGARFGYCEIPVEYTEGLNRYKDLKRIFELLIKKGFTYGHLQQD